MGRATPGDEPGDLLGHLGDGTMPESEFLDRLVDATTACLTWARLVEMMAGGYTPTVYPTTRRKRLLIRCIRAAGYRTWPDARTGGT